ncbi:hypothetical protein IE4872_PC00285 (plasmid) [Rhizobium gallicum]|uniref:Uncharacterized protein n=1 Tax=Rhizobium gallicum TaxID=56730 RepID=A0A1L5NR12_9HYPH|nr:hypothetical protein IE4872_PC00285 [Rhizobium gallicum]
MWFCEKAAQCRGIDTRNYPTEPATRAKSDAAYDGVLQLLNRYQAKLYRVAAKRLLFEGKSNFVLNLHWDELSSIYIE